MKRALLGEHQKSLEKEQMLEQDDAFIGRLVGNKQIYHVFLFCSNM